MTSFMFIKVFCALSMLSKGCVGGGGGGGQQARLPGLVTKQQAVEFPQVQASIIVYYCP